MRERDRVRSIMSRFHQRYDLLLTPSLPLTAFDAGIDAPVDPHGESWANWTPFTYPFNLTGQPAASVPCGLASDGLPVGLHPLAAWPPTACRSACRSSARAMPTPWCCARRGPSSRWRRLRFRRRDPARPARRPLTKA